MPHADTGVLKGRIELRSGDHHASLEVSLPRGMVPLDELIPLARHMSSVVVTWATEDAKLKTRPCSCSPGCAACCRCAVSIGHAEARHLAEFVESLPEARRTAIRQRFAAALDAITGTGLLARWAELAAIEGRDPQLAAADFDLWAVESVPKTGLAPFSCRN